MEDEAVPVLFLERFDEASVHGDALVEGKIGNRFDHVHAVVDILLGEEWVYVAYEELKIDETIAIRHDDGQLVCVGGRFLSAAALQRQILELGLDLADLEDDGRTRRFVRLLDDVALVNTLYSPTST